jgi:hypothetical protein
MERQSGGAASFSFRSLDMTGNPSAYAMLEVSRVSQESAPLQFLSGGERIAEPGADTEVRHVAE